MAQQTKRRRTKKKPPAATQEPHPDYLTPAEFGRIFKWSVSAVRESLEKGTVRSIVLPSAGGKRVHRRIPYSEVERIEAGK